MAKSLPQPPSTLVSILSSTVLMPGGVVKFDTGGGGKTLVYFLDPDGVIVELAEYR